MCIYNTYIYFFAPFVLIDDLRVFPHNFERASSPLLSLAVVGVVAIDTAAAKKPFRWQTESNDLFSEPKTTDFC